MSIKKTLCALISSVIVFSASGGIAAYADWEKTSEGTKYWSESENKYATGRWVIGDGDYCFNSDGIMQTGWVTDDSGRTYYFSKTTGKMRTGWLKTSSGNKYYFDATGVMQTGWLEIKGKLYYFQSNGKAVIGKTVKINGVSYTFDENGAWDGNGTNPLESDSSSDSADSSSSLSEQYKEMCEKRDEAYGNVSTYTAVYDSACSEKQECVDKMDYYTELLEKLCYLSESIGWTEGMLERAEKYEELIAQYRAEANSYNSTITESAKKRNEWSKLYNEYKKQAASLKSQISG
ncbi:MAG: hypothetical protein LUI05_03870 [Oscillospiraceae bacterium]|nr:hypothetical protein [Oscillospiraceae bacterium]